MEYNNLNNFLQNLELNQKETEKKFQEKLENDGCTLYSKNDLLNDNRNQDVLLNREFNLNNSRTFNFQVANPQRMSEESTKNNNYNEKINNYTFNNNLNVNKNKNTNIDNRFESFNSNANKFSKNNINDKLNNREMMPTKANFNLSLDN